MSRGPWLTGLERFVVSENQQLGRAFKLQPVDASL